MCYTRDLVQYHLLLSVAWASALRSCLTDVNPQDLSLSLSLTSRPVPAAATTPRADFFVSRYQWLLSYKRSAFNKKKTKNKQNIIPPNRDVPHIHEEKGKKNQPPLPLLCSQRLGSILFPFIRGTTMEGLFSLCLTPEVLSQGMQMLLVPSLDGAL